MAVLGPCADRRERRTRAVAYYRRTVLSRPSAIATKTSAGRETQSRSRHFLGRVEVLICLSDRSTRRIGGIPE